MFAGRFPNKVATEKTFDLSVGERNSITRDALPYESLLLQKYDDGSVKVLSDVDLLFNQERLDRMSKNALLERINQAVQAGDSQLSEIKKNLSDEDLQKFIKSRYIQSLSELRQWTHYLTTTYAAELDKLKTAQVVDQPVVQPTSPTGAAPASTE